MVPAHLVDRVVKHQAVANTKKSLKQMMKNVKHAANCKVNISGVLLKMRGSCSHDTFHLVILCCQTNIQYLFRDLSNAIKLVETS